MKIKTLPVGPYAVNCSILWNHTKKALIIDPGYDLDLIEEVLGENGLSVAAILLTHGHADHISALTDLYAAHPAPIYLHGDDVKWAFGENNQILPHYPVPTKPDTQILDPTKEPPCYGFQGLEVGSTDGPIISQSLEKSSKPQRSCLETIETPGHTPGGVCYWFKNENICFTGDTLFKGSCGRTDLPGGDARTLTASLKKLAETLPPETRIVAGHGEDSTMAHELATNFYLQRYPS